MHQYNNLISDKPISGESFFDEISNDSILLDKVFVPLDKSMIWHCNYLFWKYFSLWEKTYNEQYEASLPSGISESHKDEFIEKSAQKFLNLLLTLEKKQNLPEKIIILEQ